MIVVENQGEPKCATPFDELNALHTLLNEVTLTTILAFIAAQTYDAADSCDGEGRDTLLQLAAVVGSAANFCHKAE